MTKGIFKPQRFESNKLMDFEKLQISNLKMSSGQEQIFISHCFHYHDAKSHKSDQVNARSVVVEILNLTVSCAKCSFGAREKFS